WKIDLERGITTETMTLDLHQAMNEKKPTIVEVYVDPFEPPMPPKVDLEFVTNLAQSFAKGQPYKSRIGLTLFRNKVHEVLKEIHTRIKLE
ncbi:MAG: hypothetical protein L0H53_15285, partial [Candidatus Nitrosocosmicus sp.]|nr:hypothetical protein [Candidatus Nitrosocosmicus sp.]